MWSIRRSKQRDPLHYIMALKVHCGDISFGTQVILAASSKFEHSFRRRIIRLRRWGTTYSLVLREAQLVQLSIPLWMSSSPVSKIVRKLLGLYPNIIGLGHQL